MAKKVPLHRSILKSITEAHDPTRFLNDLGYLLDSVVPDDHEKIIKAVYRARDAFKEELDSNTASVVAKLLKEKKRKEKAKKKNTENN